MAWQPLGRNGRSLSADGSAVTTDADGLGHTPKLHKRPVIDGESEKPGVPASRALFFPGPRCLSRPVEN
jgi:hypothetical protein